MKDEPIYGIFLCSPTNSQMFTECCEVAICSDQRRCPKCNSLIHGHDIESTHWRGVARWKMAYKPKR
jgi:hypothetical protein